jgi:hypothetical protein
MLALIHKDVLLHKVAYLGFVPILVIFLPWLAYVIDSPAVYASFACTYGSVLPIVLIAREDVFRANSFTCSLPVTRRRVVQARYLISWAIALALTLLGLGLYSIFSTVEPFEAWSVSTAQRVLVTLSLVLGVALPFALRFGWIGLTVLGVGLQLAGIVFLFILKTFSASRWILDGFNAIPNCIEGARSMLGDPVFLVATLAALAIFNLASCEVAVALYKRREF